MKKTLLFATLLTSFLAKAQFTQANHSPTSGDAFITTQCDSTGILIGGSGAGSVWSYSNLIVRTSIENNYVATVSSNTANSGYLKVSSSLTNSSYYSSNSSRLNYHGGNIVIGAVNAELNYTSPAIIASYPMSLGTTTSNAIAGTGNLTGLGAVTFSGSCTVLADGTGTLVIGTRTLTNATRLKTTQVLNVTASFISGVITLVDYDYYSIDNSKRPFLTISTATLTSPLQSPSSQTVVTIQKNPLTVGLTEKTSDSSEFSIFPNPSNSIINFNSQSINASHILVYDVTGRIIATEVYENGKVKLNVYNLNAGVYFYTVVGKNNQILKTDKFIVTK